jgi:predicted nucleic acid-binding protein
MNGSFLVDSNVLIYATLADDRRYPVALQVLERRRLPGCRMFFSAQNLAEMFPTLTGPRTQPTDSPAVARTKILSVAALHPCTVLPVTRQVVELALELCERHGISKQRYFDMQLVATMLLAGIPEIVTENTADFDGIPSIRAVNPFTEESASVFNDAGP